MQGRITFAQCLGVSAILGILASIAYPLTATERESAQQATCVGNFKHIFAAIASYSADHVGDDIPGLDGVARGYFRTQIRELPPTFRYCPDSPSAFRHSRLISTYNWNYDDPAWYAPGRHQQSKWEQQAASIARLGPAYPLVICFQHDVYHYQPLDAAAPSFEKKPFAIELRASGAVWSGRRSGMRPSAFRL